MGVSTLNFGVPVITSLTINDPPGVCNFGAPADRYEFNLASEITLRLDLTSDGLDTYVCLFDGSMTPLAYSDDWGAGLNPHLAATLNAGAYYVEVTSEQVVALGAESCAPQLGPPASPM